MIQDILNWIALIFIAIVLLWVFSPRLRKVYKDFQDEKEAWKNQLGEKK